MIEIEKRAWEGMLAHASAAYPEECCGAMLGLRENGVGRVTAAVPMENVAAGPRRSRYQIRPEDLLRAEQLAVNQGLTAIGIYHSHPDAGAYFSETDLRLSCPWYSFVVLSVRGGRVEDARSFRPDADQTSAAREPLSLPKEEVAWPRS